MPANRYYDGPVSGHYDGERFFNPRHPPTDRSLFDLLRWRLFGSPSRWTAAPPTRPNVPPRSVNGLVTMIGHASLLVQVPGQNILIDPVWSERASPFTWAGPRRANAPGVAFDSLPPIDTVLLTHCHYDHLDIATLRSLWERHTPRVIAPLGNDRVVARGAPGIVVETFDWHQSLALGDVTVHLTPANHWSARGLGDRRMALWCGYMIVSPVGSIYVVGDTGYGDGALFRDLRERHGEPDLALIPIGAYEPRWFMKNQHVNPDDAVRLFLDCGARRAAGVHWGTFQLTDEPRDEPREKLRDALKAHGIDEKAFVALEPGETMPVKPPAEKMIPVET